MMPAGRFRHRVTLQRQQQTQNPVTGAIDVIWETVATGIPAAIEPLSVKEFISAQSKQSKITTRIVIRWRSGVDATMRIVHGDTIYNIEGPLPDKNSGLEYITVPCSQGVNQGQ